MRDIRLDARYGPFVERYQPDPLRFAVEVCNLKPSQDQEDLFLAMTQQDARVAVVSGCFAADTMMMRSDGSAVAVQDVAVGDRLMGPDGSSVRNVLELKRGRETMYRFTYQDRTSHVVNESHILCLVNTYAKNGRKPGDLCNVTVRDYLTWNKTKRRSHSIYRSGVEDFERVRVELPIDPYILGVWLGDGSTGKAAITTADQEVADAWVAFAHSHDGYSVAVTEQRGCSEYAIRRDQKVGVTRDSPLITKFRDAGVFDRKCIPDAYLYASKSDRLELVAGLIDTDGYFDANSGGYDWVQKDEELAQRFCWLVRSIECHATIAKCRKGCQTGAVGDYWRVTIGRGVDRIPVRVARRKPAGREAQRKELWHGIQSVECLGEGDFFGFMVDGDSRYLGHDFTVLHNTSTGKTAAVGRLVLWHLLCHPIAIENGDIQVGSNTYIAAPVVQQVAEGVWKEMSDARMAIGQGPQAWILEYFTITKTRVVVHLYEEQWFISIIALKKGESVTIAGKHRYWQMIVVDEASGVGDDHAKVIDGTQTSGGNRTLLLSQGARTAGWFYDAHHKNNIMAGGRWVALRFSSEDSPFATDDWLAERERECGGRDTLEYMIRVRGLFGEDTSKILLSRVEMEAAFVGMPQVPLIGPDEPYGIMLMGDVGMGEYRDESVLVAARVIGQTDFGPDARRVEYYAIPICTNSRDPIDYAGDVRDYFGQQDNPTLYVDDGGVGATVVKLLERDGIPVQRVNWGKPCFRREYQQRFYNLRACAQVRFRDAVKQKRAVFVGRWDQRIKQKILDQGSRLPYFFRETGGLRFQMVAKEDMAKEGIKSPDVIDAASFVFLEGASYMPRANASLGGPGNAVQSAVERLAALAAQMQKQVEESDPPEPGD